MKHILDNIIIDKKRNYFDFTASGLAYKPIEDEIQNILLTYSNTHSKYNSNSLLTSTYYSQARDSLYNTLSIDDTFVVLPVGTGASGAIKKFQELLGLYIPPKTQQRYDIDPINKPLVIIGPFEHHSNEVSFREAICDVIRIPLCDAGYTNIEKLKEVVARNKHREIIGSFSVASNVSGVFNPIKSISHIIRSVGGVVAFDAAATSGHMNIDSDLYDAMFALFFLPSFPPNLLLYYSFFRK